MTVQTRYVLAIAAIATIGAAALAPTSASAHGGKRFWHGHWRVAPIVVVDDDDCGWKWYRKRGYWYKVWSCD